MNSFEILNEDEVHYFSYINENIEYLEKLFNRKIEYEMGVIMNYGLELINEDIIGIISNEENHVSGIIFKLTKSELNNLVKINNLLNYRLIQNESNILYGNYYSEPIETYYFIPNRYVIHSSNLSFEEMKLKVHGKLMDTLKNIHKIFNDCKHIYNTKYNKSNNPDLFYDNVKLYNDILVYYYDTKTLTYKQLI